MVTTKLPQLPRTKPIKISRNRYSKLESIAKNQNCTLDEAIDIYIEQKLRDVAKNRHVTSRQIEKIATKYIENPLDAGEVITALIRDVVTKCTICSDLLCKELERHGHKIVIDESKNVSHCIDYCKLCLLNSPVNTSFK
ncbi:MAG TPA: hypothetical protein VJ792_02270 [Candidatus Nitrosotalea sp.]|nr:hypothetical protein [Candidatus Nitrosotalea sp.]